MVFRKKNPYLCIVIQKNLFYDVFFMDEKEIKKVFELFDSIETIEDVINNISRKYTIGNNEENYNSNKKMLTEFAIKMGLISRNIYD